MAGILPVQILGVLLGVSPHLLVGGAVWLCKSVFKKLACFPFTIIKRKKPDWLMLEVNQTWPLPSPSPPDDQPNVGIL